MPQFASLGNFVFQPNEQARRKEAVLVAFS